MATLTSARTAEVDEVLTLRVGDGMGGDMVHELSARFDRDAGRAEGTFDAYDTQPGGPMSTWPDHIPTMSSTRIIGDTVYMRTGDLEHGSPWRDVTVLGDAHQGIAHLYALGPLVELLSAAVAARPPDQVEGSAIWRGTIPPDLLGEVWTSGGPVGLVLRFTSGMPTELIDDVHAYEIEAAADGSMRMSVWLDVVTLARNVGEPEPPEPWLARVDSTWSAVGRPVTIDEPVLEPESVAD